MSDMIPRRKFRDIAEANQYKTVRKQCMPLLELAKGKPAGQQLALHQTVVQQIAAVLGVEATEHDLDPYPHYPRRALITYDPAIWGFTYSPILAEAS